MSELDISKLQYIRERVRQKLDETSLYQFKGTVSPTGRMRDGVQYRHAIGLIVVRPIRLLPAFLISQKSPLRVDFCQLPPGGSPGALPRQCGRPYANSVR